MRLCELANKLLLLLILLLVLLMLPPDGDWVCCEDNISLLRNELPPNAGVVLLLLVGCLLGPLCDFCWTLLDFWLLLLVAAAGGA